MAKVGRPFLNASRKRVEVLGDVSKTVSTTEGDSTRTSIESGETYIITSAAGQANTITLPPVAASGQYFKFIWGVASDAHETIIATNDSAEKIEGNILFLKSDHPGHATNDMDVVATDGVSISVHDDIEPGSWLELLSDGTKWYVVSSNIIATATPAVAT
tara:strand:- start:16554 stop:17033 length:480 start_codon:yes stop_codon:yes gene_type:complete